MVETPETSIANKLSELLGNDSSTIAPYTLVQEPTPSVVQPAPTTPVNNIEPRNTEDTTPITVNTDVEDNTTEEAKHVPSSPISPVNTSTIEPVNTIIPKEEPVPIIQNNNIPVDAIIDEITANLQDTLNKQQTPVVKPAKVDTTTIQPTENIKANTESQTPNLVQQAASNIEQAYIQSAQGVSKGTNNVAPYDAAKKDINQQISQKFNTPVDKVESRLRNIYNTDPQKYKGLEYYFGDVPELRENTATPTVDSILDKISSEQSATPTVDKISNEQSLKKEKLPTSKIEPILPNTENITPTTLQPSQLNTTIEPNNESVLNNAPLDNPKFSDIADNTNQTNILLENLTKAMYMFAASKGENTPAMPPIPVQVPSSASSSNLNAVPDSVNATYSGMIPTIRSRFV